MPTTDTGGGRAIAVCHWGEGAGGQVGHPQHGHRQPVVQGLVVGVELPQRLSAPLQPVEELLEVHLLVPLPRHTHMRGLSIWTV